jgi:recombination protein RecR
LEIESLVKRVEIDGVKGSNYGFKYHYGGRHNHFYIFRKLAPFNIKITTIARGIAVGDELEYTDEVTLGRSIVNRVEFTNSFK